MQMLQEVKNEIAEGMAEIVNGDSDPDYLELLQQIKYEELKIQSYRVIYFLAKVTLNYSFSMVLQVFMPLPLYIICIAVFMLNEVLPYNTPDMFDHYSHFFSRYFKSLERLIEYS